MPKPPGVVHLFRDYGTHVAPTSETQDAGTLVDLEDLQQTQMILELKDSYKELVSFLILSLLFIV